MTHTASSFTVIVPALNEEENLGPLLEAVLKEFGSAVASLEVLVFNDASTDRTGAVAEAFARRDPRIRVLHNATRLNVGGIYKAGIREAAGEYLLMLPGDNEIRVDEVVKGVPFLTLADVVVFYVKDTRVRTWARRALSAFYMHVVNVLFGTGLRYTNGTNIWRTDVIRRIPIHTNGFFYNTEALVKATRSAVRLVQVGIDIKPRDTGRSKALTLTNFTSVAKALGLLWWDVHIRERRVYGSRGRLVGTF